MTMGSTAKQQAPYPMADEFLKDVNDHVRRLAQWADDRVVMRFATQTALGTAIPAPVAGQLAFIVADKVLQLYDGTGWKRVYPSSPAIYTGTATPAASLGAVGDIYIQYS
jgi:hypothetical protein